MMDEKRAREILKGAPRKDGGLNDVGEVYVDWKLGDEEAVVDGRATADVLEAIAWWMKNKSSPTCT